MLLLDSIQKSSFSDFALFRVPLPNRSDVFMSARRNLYTSAHESLGLSPPCVVIVDSALFLAMWRKEPFKFNYDVSSGNPDTWPSDRKFSNAVNLFARSIINPVWLADVVCDHHIENTPVYEKRYFLFDRIVDWEEHEFQYVNIDDGITRTIWLLTHCAKYFPVICSLNDGAELLADKCGAPGDNFSLLTDLFPTI